MAESESVPLLPGKGGDFREVAQPGVPDTVACCCLESSRLAKVPVIRTVFRKRRPEEKVTYPPSHTHTQTWHVFLSCFAYNTCSWKFAGLK